jgi:hypothetical protein
MPKKVFLSFSIFLVCFCAVPLSFSADKEPDVQKILNRLEKTWKIQQKEIATAHLVYRHVHWQKLANPSWVKLTPQEIADIVVKQDFSKSDKAFDELVTKFHVDPSYITKEEVFYAPPKSRIQSTVPDIYKSKISSGIKDYISVFDGTNTISVDPLNNQTDIRPGGDAFSIERLRFDPSFLSSAIRDKFSFQVHGELLKAVLDTERGIIHKFIDIETGLLLN